MASAATDSPQLVGQHRATADQTFTAEHRCDDLRGGPPPRIGDYLLHPIDIGAAVRSGRIVIGSMPSITALFAGVAQGVRDVVIADAPPWQIDLVTLRSRAATAPPSPQAFAAALRTAATMTSTKGLEPVAPDSG